MKNQFFQNDESTYYEWIKEDDPSLSDDEIYALVSDAMCFDLHNMKDLFDMEKDTPLIALGMLQFWNGSKPGYKIIDYNLNSMFELIRNFDYAEFYVENKRVYVNLTHHDGTHVLEIRQLRENKNTDYFLNKFTTGDYDARLVNRYTKSIYKDVSQRIKGVVPCLLWS